MSSPFLAKDYVAFALIKEKSEIFDESFTTVSELNQFTLFMQQKFNERELGVVIVYELDRENFNVKNGVITINERSWINLDRLPNEILNILTDTSLILEFFLKIETRRLEILQSLPEYVMDTPASKQLSRVLPN